MAVKMTRRDVLKASAMGAFAVSILPASAIGANSKIQVGCIGIGGKGYQDTQGVAHAGGKIVALCDVADFKRNPNLANNKKRSGGGILAQFPKARFFTDYREMLNAASGIDAVTVSIPDHHHFHASMLAIKKRKHVYCQKPLTHSIWEARELTKAAKKYGVQTQMGNQAHSGEPVRRAVELIRAGMIGKVSEVHCWTNRPIWPQGHTQRPKREPVPKGLDWEQWLGPAPFVDYGTGYAPFAWRGWWDYGTGALGDMACHIMDMPYWALKLGSPDSVAAESDGCTPLSPPHWSTVTYRFPDNLKFCWYDGVKAKDDKYLHVPPDELWKADWPSAHHVFRRFGSLLVGEKGRMYFGRDRMDWVVKPEAAAKWEEPPKSLPRVPYPGGKKDKSKWASGSGGPYFEWLNAIQTGTPALSNFAQSGPFTEMVLLGNLAIRLNRKITWDAANLKCRDLPEADPLIKREYRKGWEV